MILIITGKDDLTTDYLICRLEQRHLSFFRFNTEDLLSGFAISLRVESDHSDLSLTDIRRRAEIRLADITAAYFRKPQVPIPEGQSEEQTFNRRELSETLRSIWPETSVDWRAWDVTGVNLVHERFDLPKKLRTQCVELNRRFNLRFFCIDMVQVKNGDFYFLEVNPNGQWAWIEEMVRS